MNCDRVRVRFDLTKASGEKRVAVTIISLLFVAAIFRTKLISRMKDNSRTFIVSIFRQLMTKLCCNLAEILLFSNLVWSFLVFLISWHNEHTGMIFHPLRIQAISRSWVLESSFTPIFIWETSRNLHNEKHWCVLFKIFIFHLLSSPERLPPSHY